MLGTKKCFAENSKDDYQKCIFVLFCDLANIYVIGEQCYGTDIGFLLPGFSSIDQFTSNDTRVLADEIQYALQGNNYERVLASDLAGPLPEGIEIDSNLVGESEVLFDGYFYWTD